MQDTGNAIVPGAKADRARKWFSIAMGVFLVGSLLPFGEEPTFWHYGLKVMTMVPTLIGALFAKPGDPWTLIGVGVMIVLAVGLLQTGFVLAGPWLIPQLQRSRGWLWCARIVAILVLLFSVPGLFRAHGYVLDVPTPQEVLHQRMEVAGNVLLMVAFVLQAIGLFKIRGRGR